MIFHMSISWVQAQWYVPKRKQTSRVFVSSPHPAMSVVRERARRTPPMYLIPPDGLGTR